MHTANGSTERGNGSLCQRLAGRLDFWPCANFTWHIYFLSFSSTAAHKRFGVYRIVHSCSQRVQCIPCNIQLLIKIWCIPC